MRWLVVARYNGRKRKFNVFAPTFETAKNDALHLAFRFYATNSGTLGNEVWQNGVITLRNERIEPVIIYEPHF